MYYGHNTCTMAIIHVFAFITHLESPFLNKSIPIVNFCQTQGMTCSMRHGKRILPRTPTPRSRTLCGATTHIIGDEPGCQSQMNTDQIALPPAQRQGRGAKSERWKLPKDQRCGTSRAKDEVATASKRWAEAANDMARLCENIR